MNPDALRDDVTVRPGIEDRDRLPLAAILYDGLRDKFAPLFGDRERAVPVIAHHLRSVRCLTARRGPEVVGIAGLKYAGRGFFDLGLMRAIGEFGIRTFPLIFYGLPLEAFPRRDEVYLECLAVSEVQRGVGVGTRLLGAALSHAWRDGARRVRLDVATDNASAVSLYERRGFRILRVRSLPFPWCRVFGTRGFAEMVRDVDEGDRVDEEARVR